MWILLRVCDLLFPPSDQTEVEFVGDVITMKVVTITRAGRGVHNVTMEREETASGDFNSSLTADLHVVTQTGDGMLFTSAFLCLVI